jgi:hypothetical protein
MKKLLLAIAVLLVLGICAIYIFIPKEIVVSHSTTINTSDKNVFEYLKDNKKQAKWLPVNESLNNTAGDTTPSFQYGNQTFTTEGLLYNSLAVNIEQDGIVEKTKIIIVAIKADSVEVVWKSNLHAGLNPVTRVKTYLTATNTKKNMAAILADLKSFLDKSENIYGSPIVYEKIKDTLYIANTIVQNTYLDTKQLTTAIEKLHAYTKLTGGKESGFPIMIVSHLETGEYRTVIGMPISNLIPETKDFVLKRMPQTGRAVTTVIVGGMQSMFKGLGAITKYQSDYYLDQPIIPFFSLITDRAKETDSSKWVTKIWGTVY